VPVGGVRSCSDPAHPLMMRGMPTILVAAR
jgi:hypothetical protein